MVPQPPEIDFGRLIRTLAYALRHHPEQFGVTLDAEGWADAEHLLQELRFRCYSWALLAWHDIESAIAGSDRFEVQAGRIRAAYGHSVILEQPPPTTVPSLQLYHGTPQSRVTMIWEEGILHMGRRFVHLSSSYDWVRNFVSEMERWTIFAIDTATAGRAGTIFRKANTHVWLTDWVDPRFLTVQTTSTSPVTGPS